MGTGVSIPVRMTLVELDERGEVVRLHILTAKPLNLPQQLDLPKMVGWVEDCSLVGGVLGD